MDKGKKKKILLHTVVIVYLNELHVRNFIAVYVIIIILTT